MYQARKININNKFNEKEKIKLQKLCRENLKIPVQEFVKKQNKFKESTIKSCLYNIKNKSSAGTKILSLKNWYILYQLILEKGNYEL